MTLKLPGILYPIKLDFQNHSKLCLVPGCSAIYKCMMTWSMFLIANSTNHAIQNKIHAI